MAGEDDGAYEVASIVIDPGCGVFKSGFSTESEPRLVFQSVVGRVKVGPDGNPEDTTPGSDDDEYGGGGGAGGEDDEAKGDGKLLFGDDVAADRDSLFLSHPLQGGRIKNWDDFEVWQQRHRHAMRCGAKLFTARLLACARACCHIRTTALVSRPVSTTRL